MRLSDVMSAMQLSGWAEVALLIFFAAFVAITVHVLRRSNRERFEALRNMPLDDDVPQAPRAQQR